MIRRTVRVVLALAATAAIAPSIASAAAPPDYCLGQCSDILPPGANGHATLAEILANKALGVRPAHTDDQLGPYAALAQGANTLTDSNLNNFFNDASLGVPSTSAEKTYSPRADVTIVRDARGIPHITGTTRAGTEFGAGYAGAEDRLFVMDLMRHVGRGSLTSFAGGAPGNRVLEQNLWRAAPYTEDDLQAQVQRLADSGPRGAQLLSDIDNYLDGVNAYISKSHADRTFPGEYVVTGHADAITNAGGPEPFTRTDLIAIAAVIGGLFGNGGGEELNSALVKQAAEAKYGVTQGDRVWAALRDQDDPEATTTVHDGTRFPYGTAPGDTSGVAMPDAGTLQDASVVQDPTGSAASASAASASSASKSKARSLRVRGVPKKYKKLAGMFSGGAMPGLKLGGHHQGMSNALVVSGANTKSGNPVAVFGPQTGYFAPQLLMQEELQGPGISARGVSFSGLNFYVEIGRGPDYAWSPTSAEQDITDTYAVPLCETDGSTPTRSSKSYMFHGTCTPMEKLERSDSWSPTLADGTASGSYKLVTYRTKYGLVSGTATRAGKPVAYTALRSTYLHEADSALGFQMLNDPDVMKDADGFKSAASNIDFAFNWFYVNDHQSAYYDSGRNPVRAAGADPNLPVKAEPQYEWRNWNPATNTEDVTAPAQHPQSVNQDYYVSWNNKQAPGYRAADGNFSYGSVQRVDLLDRGVKTALAQGQKLDRAGLTKIMENAATTDLRGSRVLPTLLKVIDSGGVPSDPATASAVGSLRTWLDHGARRVEAAQGDRRYVDADAIRVFDAWWPKLVAAEFRPGMGDDLYAKTVRALQINESPSGGQNGDVSGGAVSTNQAQSHKGSSFQFGWWGYVDKDLRSVLGQSVQNGLPLRYCGGGDLPQCRATLLSSLAAAAGEPAATTYPGDKSCSAGDQWCADTIVQSPLGGVTDDAIAWQNRPTYQQVVSFPAGRGDDVSNLALGRPVSATSYQHGLFQPTLPASNAVDGSLSTRWASAWRDGESITVDLGSVRTVARTILRWESAYGKAYKIETSADGTSWRQAYATTAGDGGTDDDAFGSAVQARYVRLTGVQRATSYGYSLYELEVYAH